MKFRRGCLTIPLALPLGVIAVALLVVGLFPNHGIAGCGVTYACDQPGPSRSCRAGNGPDDLQIHIVGSKRDTIVVYFRNEFFQHKFQDTQDLGCGTDVVLAPKNDFGTFAVIYGKKRDRCKVFGWKKDAAAPEASKEIVLAPEASLSGNWVSTRIFKIKFGKSHDKVYILRFSDAEPPFKAFFQTGTNSPLDPNSN